VAGRRDLLLLFLILAMDGFMYRKKKRLREAAFLHKVYLVEKKNVKEFILRLYSLK
jgi:hypothetical protein